MKAPTEPQATKPPQRPAEIQKNPRDAEPEGVYGPGMARPARPVLAPSPLPTPATTPTASPTAGPDAGKAPAKIAAAQPPVHLYASMGSLALRIEAGPSGPVCLVSAASLLAWFPSQNIACAADRVAKIIAEAKGYPQLAGDVDHGPEGLLTERGARAVVTALNTGIVGALAEDELARAFARAAASLEMLRPKPTPTAAAPSVAGASPKVNPVTEGPTTTDLALEERAQIIDALRKARQNRTEAAKLIGMPRRSFYRKLREYGIVAD